MNYESSRDCLSKNVLTQQEFVEQKQLVLDSLSVGAANMLEKVESYARERLPGGCYWDPDHKTKAVLKEFQPSNDLCESILGLNDLSHHCHSSLHQMTQSNLIEVKNKTIEWISHLPEDQFENVVDYAMKRKGTFERSSRRVRSKQRREQMVQAKKRREALQRRAEKERNELSQLHLITSLEELAEINKANSASKKKAKKLDILKTQVCTRKKGAASKNYYYIHTIQKATTPQ